MKVIFLKAMPKRNYPTYTRTVPIRAIFYKCRSSEELESKRLQLAKVIAVAVQACENYCVKFAGAMVLPNGEILACTKDPEELSEQMLK